MTNLKKLFDENSYNLLLPKITTYKLTYECPSTGSIYPAGDQDTKLFVVGKSDENIDIKDKFKNDILYSVYDIVNPKIKKTCSKCSRKVVTYQKFGSELKTVFSCVCGNNWT